MPHEIKIHYDDDLVEGKLVEVAATFDDNEWETLLQFADEVRKLEAAGYIAKKPRINANVRFDANGVSFTHQNLPTPDELAVVLHRIRPFILKKNEPLEFGRIVNLLKRRIENARVRAMLDQHKDIFHAKRAQSQLVVASKDVVLNSESVLMDYLNAYEYHRAEDLKAQVDEWFKPLPAEHRLYIVVDLLFEKISCIIAIGAFIDWLNKGAPGKIFFA